MNARMYEFDYDLFRERASCRIMSSSMKQEKIKIQKENQDILGSNEITILKSSENQRVLTSQCTLLKNKIVRVKRLS